MRIALVSPCSWTYPGGVNGHVAALAHELRRVGDDVPILAPSDAPDRRSRLLHGGRAAAAPPPERLISLGRTIAIPANGAVSNLCVWPRGVMKLRREADHSSVEMHDRAKLAGDDEVMRNWAMAWAGH